MSIVTCKTEGCSNYGVPITVDIDPGEVVICGVCSERIRDVENLDDNDDVEVPPWLT